MKLLKNSLTALLFFFGLMTSFSAQATVIVSEEHMLAYLQENASDKSLLCNYTPLHYIRLDAPSFVIKAIETKVAPNGKIYFDLGSIPQKSLQSIQRRLSTLTQFQVLEISSTLVWFKPVAGATRSQIIEGLFWLKVLVDNQSANTYIQSSGDPCPGGVSVNNL